jgi:hypothetical protein
MRKDLKTIVGGRSAAYQSPDGYPRGIEILLKKAKVDLEFRRLFLQDPLAAARAIELDVSDSEKKILLNTPGDIIGKMVENTFVPKHHVSTFLSATTAAMLSLVLASVAVMPAYGTGITTEPLQEEPSSMELLAEQRMKSVQEALEQYRTDHGSYPSTIEWVTGNPLEEYINSSHLYDPWYRKFHYNGGRDESGGIINYRLESLGESTESQSDNIYSPNDRAVHKFSGENPLTILFPQPDDKITLQASDKVPILFAAEHTAGGVTLDWYLDERKIGSTVDEHSLPMPEGIIDGGHWLSVIDEKENYSSVSFIVERE